MTLSNYGQIKQEEKRLVIRTQGGSKFFRLRLVCRSGDFYCQAQLLKEKGFYKL